MSVNLKEIESTSCLKVQVCKNDISIELPPNEVVVPSEPNKGKTIPFCEGVAKCMAHSRTTEDLCTGVATAASCIFSSIGTTVQLIPFMVGYIVYAAVNVAACPCMCVAHCVN